MTMKQKAHTALASVVLASTFLLLAATILHGVDFDASEAGLDNPKRKVDLDVDANYDNEISIAAPDDPIEEDHGGVVCVGKRDEIIIRRVEPESWIGDVILKIEKGAPKINVFRTETEGTPILFNGTDNRFSGSEETKLYVQGEEVSDEPRDVELTLESIPPGGADAITYTIIKVDITNKKQILYYYQKWAYDLYSHHANVVPTATIQPSGRTVTWSILNDNTGGTTIGPNTGVLTLTDTPGTFVIRADDSVAADCYDEQKCMIIDVNTLKSPPSNSENRLIYYSSPPHLEYLAWGIDCVMWALINYPQGGGEQDAARHLYWQASVAADDGYGLDEAREWGAAHEYEALQGGEGITQSGSTPQNNSMDLHNNTIGQIYGLALGGPSGVDTTDPVWYSQIEQFVALMIAIGVDPYINLNPEVGSEIPRIEDDI